MLLYVQSRERTIRDRQPRTATSNSTQLLSSDVGHKAAVNFVEHQQVGCIIFIVQIIKACPLQTLSMDVTMPGDPSLYTLHCACVCVCVCMRVCVWLMIAECHVPGCLALNLFQKHIAGCSCACGDTRHLRHAPVWGVPL